MNSKSSSAFLQMQENLKQFPDPLYMDFQSALEVMDTVLDQDRLMTWTSLGLDLAQQKVRSWEVARVYFETSPKVIKLVSFDHFVKWFECGLDICKQSPSLAVTYFEYSYKSLKLLKPNEFQKWASLGISLYVGTWKSSKLSENFFQKSHLILSTLSLHETERLILFLSSLTSHSHDLSSECIDLSPKLFQLLGEKKSDFMSLTSSLLNTEWRQLRGLFGATSDVLQVISIDQRPQIIDLVIYLYDRQFPNVPSVIIDISKSFGQLDSEFHSTLISTANHLSEYSPDAMAEFIKICPVVLETLDINQLDTWVEEGIKTLNKNEHAGLSYFRMESARSLKVLDQLSSNVEFAVIQNVMQMYCRALAGSQVKLSSSSEIVEKNIGWVSNESPSTEGTTVFVPSHVDRYLTKSENFSWFKVISTHQVAHLEFGSFGFEFDKPSTLFSDIRPKLYQINIQKISEDQLPEQEVEIPNDFFVTDMRRFFNLMDDRELGLDIFTIVEDGRLDTYVKNDYPGITKSYITVQHDSLKDRPPVETLPAREAILEFLIQLSLQQKNVVVVPTEYVSQARKIASVANRVFSVGANVEDSAEATLRIYAVLKSIPNQTVNSDGWQNIDLSEIAGEIEEENSEENDEEYINQFTDSTNQGDHLKDEQEYKPVTEVEYRGDYKPELVQLLDRLRNDTTDTEGSITDKPVAQEMLQELLSSSAEIDLHSVEGDFDKSTKEFVDNILKEGKADLANDRQSGQGQFIHIDDQNGSLESGDSLSFVYDEWDFRARDYKPNWCIVHQKVMAEGDDTFYARTLHSYRSLVNQVRRQFELILPEMFRKVKRLEDGEEIDIDEVLELFIDIRTGVTPNDKLFWRRNKVQRDVAVVFLIDTSASTAEAIDDSKSGVDAWSPPTDPVEYMNWLKARQASGPRRPYKRIIDLEKEAVVLLIDALESVGDVYGIYGFSGYGRENVEFYTVKDISEKFSVKVKKRIDSISPLHATRMGPAIRHATYKLDQVDARTKLLFLISDGRPQDRGYSREGVEKEYAVHDTKKALDEAKNRSINAFCLTVDKNGHDYLKTMCEDVGYEILDDINSLPKRLLYLYKRLTM